MSRDSLVVTKLFGVIQCHLKMVPWSYHLVHLWQYGIDFYARLPCSSPSRPYKSNEFPNMYQTINESRYHGVWSQRWSLIYLYIFMHIKICESRISVSLSWYSLCCNLSNIIPAMYNAFLDKLCDIQPSKRVIYKFSFLKYRPHPTTPIMRDFGI